MRPPIPEPNGNIGALTKEQLRSGISLDYQFSLASHVRKMFKGFDGGTFSIMLTCIVILVVDLPFALNRAFSALELVTIAICIVSGLGLFHLLGALASFPLHARRRWGIVLTPYGVTRRYGARLTEIKWSTFSRIIVWSGDVVLWGFASTIFIPRETFSSPQEAQEFLQIARELHKSRGAAWRDEWNGKTFGRNA